MSFPGPELRWVAVGRIPSGRRLRARERVLLAAEILSAYGQARRTLRRLPIETALQSLRASSASLSDISTGPEAALRGGVLEEARRLGHAVERTLSLLPGDTRCLVRSLVLTRLLARRGISAKLVIGARTAPEFLAHAWVEYGGAAVLSPGDGSFGRLVEL